MASSDLTLRRNGTASALARVGMSPTARRLAAEAGHELLASDLNRLIAERGLHNVERYFDEQLRADGRIANEAEKQVREHPTLGPPMVAETCQEFKQATRAIVHSRLLG